MGGGVYNVILKYPLGFISAKQRILLYDWKGSFVMLLHEETCTMYYD